MVRTLNDAYLDLRAELRRAGVSGAQVEARELVCHALGIDRDDFYAKRDLFVFDKQWGEICALKERRLSGEPVQYITGKWEFYSIPLFITEDTLIPRADTEVLVETAIDFLKTRDKGRLLDLCCGCGAVGIATLKNVSEGITGTFCDISERALQVARKNLLHNLLTIRALTNVVDVVQPPPENMGKYNVIVCNPPYIPTAELQNLDPEVKREPQIALDGGRDGLDFYRAISKNYKAMLARGGALMFEVGLGQWDSVKAIMKNYGYRSIQVKKDLEGIERVVWGVNDQK